MTTMTETGCGVTGGVDTHKDVHVAAALDEVGRVLGTAEFQRPRLGIGSCRDGCVRSVRSSLSGSKGLDRGVLAWPGSSPLLG